MKIAVSLILIAGAISSAAHADVIEFGVVSRCDKKQMLFEVGGVVQHNEQFTLIASSLREANHLKYGETHLVCRIGGAVARATIVVSPPTNGHCMGAGYAELTKFTIDEKSVSLFPNRETFNYSCLDERMLIKLSAHVLPGGALVVERCTSAAWTWENGYSKIECTNQAHAR